MKIHVKYFARVREKLGSDERVQWAPDPGAATVGDLRQWLSGQSAAHADALGHGQCLRAAVDQRMCEDDEPLTDGAEVAFFPPVTGG